MKYLYPCNIKGTEENGEGFVVTFPDMNEAITGGFTFRESLILAEDCLVVALEGYIVSERKLPTPSPYRKGQELLTVQPVIAAQLDLYAAMREQNVSLADLATRLGISEPDAAPLLSLDYCTPIARVLEALEAVGQKQDLATAAAASERAA